MLTHLPASLSVLSLAIAALHADSLTIISPLPFFVNTFFKIFSRFFTFVRNVKQNLPENSSYGNLHKQEWIAQSLQLKKFKKCCTSRHIVL